MYVELHTPLIKRFIAVPVQININIQSAVLAVAPCHNINDAPLCRYHRHDTAILSQQVFQCLRGHIIRYTLQPFHRLKGRKLGLCLLQIRILRLAIHTLFFCLFHTVPQNILPVCVHFNLLFILLIVITLKILHRLF